LSRGSTDKCQPVAGAKGKSREHGKADGEVARGQDLGEAASFAVRDTARPKTSFEPRSRHAIRFGDGPAPVSQREQIENFPGRHAQRIFFSMWIRPKDSRRTCFSPATDVIDFRRLNHKPQTKSQDKTTIAAP
jgi:hypothetical protein